MLRSDLHGYRNPYIAVKGRISVRVTRPQRYYVYK